MTNTQVDPLRVALAITELEVGGAERCLTNLACGLDRQQFRPSVFVLAPRPAAPQDQLVQQLEAADVPVEFLGVTRPWQAPWAVSRLRRRLRRFRPDVLQTFLFHANVIGSIAAGRDPELAVSLGIRVADPSSWRWHLERRCARRARQVVCVSRATAQFFAGDNQQLQQRVSVIPNGVDTQGLARQSAADLTELGLVRGQRAITCVARLARQKGVDRLIAIAPELLAQLPDHVLLLVGDGPAAEQLRQAAAESAVAGRILFTGWRPDVPQILMASDLMLLTSRWEGMPNVLLEAMACGRPVVCARAEGVLEVLGPLADSQSVAIEDTQGLVSKSVAIIRQPEMAGELGRENQRRVASHFSHTAAIRAYQQLFVELADRSVRP